MMCAWVKGEFILLTSNSGWFQAVSDYNSGFLEAADASSWVRQIWAETGEVLDTGQLLLSDTNHPLTPPPTHTHHWPERLLEMHASSFSVCFQSTTHTTNIHMQAAEKGNLLLTFELVGPTWDKSHCRSHIVKCLTGCWAKVSVYSGLYSWCWVCSSGHETHRHTYGPPHCHMSWTDDKLLFIMFYITSSQLFLPYAVAVSKYIFGCRFESNNYSCCQ